jgi:hydrogenase maturation protease
VSTLVVGLGNPDRGDDGVGPAVAERVRELRLPDVEVLVEDSPASLPDVWEDADIVVVVDAVQSGRPAGSVTTIDATDEPLPPWDGSGGTHGFGLSATVELARALETLPRRLVVIGVEGSSFTVGAPLSPAVADALADAVDAVQRAAMTG